MALRKILGVGTAGKVYNVRGGFDSWGDGFNTPPSSLVLLDEWMDQFANKANGSVMTGVGNAGDKIQDIISEAVSTNLVANSPGANISVLLAGNNNITSDDDADTIMQHFRDWVSVVQTPKHVICTIPPPWRSDSGRQAILVEVNSRLLGGELGPNVYIADLTSLLLNTTNNTEWIPEYQGIRSDNAEPSSHPNLLCSQVIYGAINTTLQRITKMGYIGFGPDDPAYDTGDFDNGGAGAPSLPPAYSVAIAPQRAVVVPANSRFTKIGFKGSNAATSIRTAHIGVYTSSGGVIDGGTLLFEQAVTYDTTVANVAMDIEAVLDTPYTLLAEQELMMAVTCDSGDVNLQIGDYWPTSGFGLEGRDNLLVPGTLGATFGQDQTVNRDLVLWAEFEAAGDPPPSPKDPLVTDSAFTLGENEGKKDVVQDTGAPDPGDAEMALYLNDADLGRSQSIVGTFDVLKRYVLNNLNTLQGGGTEYFRVAVGGSLPGVSVGGVVGAGEIALYVGADFLDKARSGFIDETYRQLIAAFLEASTGN